MLMSWSRGGWVSECVMEPAGWREVGNSVVDGDLLTGHGSSECKC